MANQLEGQATNELVIERLLVKSEAMVERKVWERKRERFERMRKWLATLINIDVHHHIHIYIYIYCFTDRLI